MSISYNSEFLTTYRSFKEEYYSDLCYKIQLLQAFNMEQYDEFILQQNIKKTFYFMGENEELKVIYEILSKKNNHFEFMKELILNDKTNKESPEEILNMFFFQLLFSYDYFDIMHKCLSKYLNDLLKNQNNTNSLYFEELKKFILQN
jgi:hypothetical protein